MSSGDDWQQDPTVKRWAQHVLDEMAPKMERSALVTHLLPDGRGDPHFWVQIGASVMMDKPIIVVAFSDRKIPPKLRRIADEIVRCPEGVGPEATEKLAAAVHRTVLKVQRRGRRQ